ncbi:winged helix DNA-binding protein [Gemmobacter sp.]|uniref:winged helix DNA-binding protein n=1 Tax=Gemmobacter sp. TaxID=1898957 RepID=UPI002AFF4C92|nr:winged helix DNA-binding protein [Gemmobacter sp.]
MAEKPQKSQQDKAKTGEDFTWHLARGGPEAATAEMEFAIMRAFEGFGRWQSECLAAVCDLAATGPENAMLHIIRMNERPKSIKEIARLMNRDDVPNIQYSLRKLIGAGLVERKGSGRGGVTYEVTDEGRRVTDDYGDVRQRLLIAAIQAQPGLADRLVEATRTLTLLTGVYEDVARVAATRRRG